MTFSEFEKMLKSMEKHSFNIRGFKMIPLRETRRNSCMWLFKHKHGYVTDTKEMYNTLDKKNLLEEFILKYEEVVLLDV